MKAIKNMLLGIAFILLGIWGTIPAMNGGGVLFQIVAFGCPIIGFIIVLASLSVNK